LNPGGMYRIGAMPLTEASTERRLPPRRRPERSTRRGGPIGRRTRRISPGLWRRVDLPRAVRARRADRATDLPQSPPPATLGPRYRRRVRGERITRSSERCRADVRAPQDNPLPAPTGSRRGVLHGRPDHARTGRERSGAGAQAAHHDPWQRWRAGRGQAQPGFHRRCTEPCVGGRLHAP